MCENMHARNSAKGALSSNKLHTASGMSPTSDSLSAGRDLAPPLLEMSGCRQRLCRHLVDDQHNYRPGLEAEGCRWLRNSTRIGGRRTTDNCRKRQVDTGSCCASGGAQPRGLHSCLSLTSMDGPPTISTLLVEAIHS